MFINISTAFSADSACSHFYNKLSQLPHLRLTLSNDGFKNGNLVADGPGSSTVGIEKDNNRCLINWSQHAWIDEETKKHRQSRQIKMIVQCSPK
jgi:hypothetical protein